LTVFSVGTPSKYSSVPIDVSTLSGAVIDTGMPVVSFILGGWAASTAVMLAAINPVTARKINDLVFILFSPFNCSAMSLAPVKWTLASSKCGDLLPKGAKRDEKWSIFAMNHRLSGGLDKR
jgi:hypothetical protein